MLIETKCGSAPGPLRAPGPLEAPGPICVSLLSLVDSWEVGGVM